MELVPGECEFTCYECDGDGSVQVIRGTDTMNPSSSGTSATSAAAKEPSARRGGGGSHRGWPHTAAHAFRYVTPGARY